jgi:Carboxypeptidase regulatory-like domain
MIKRLVLGLILSLWFYAIVFAQGGATGAIQGTVQDSSGASVLGAEVRIIDQATGSAMRTLVTDEQGGFTASSRLPS